MKNETGVRDGLNESKAGNRCRPKDSSLDTHQSVWPLVLKNECKSLSPPKKWNRMAADQQQKRMPKKRTEEGRQELHHKEKE